MRQVTPKVFLIAVTRFTPGLSAYLREIGNPTWHTDAKTEGDALVEAAGRLCYRSWQPYDPTRPDCSNANVERVREGNQEYVANLLKQGHGSVLEHCNVTFIFHNVSRVFCYCPGVEVFTDLGWKQIEDVTVSDRLLTMNPVMKSSKFTNPISIHSFDYKGKVGGWSNSQMRSPLMTPDHLLWAAPYDLRRARGLSNEENISRYASKISLEEIIGKRFSIDHSINMSSSCDDSSINIGGYDYDTFDIMTWLGFMATDGCFTKDRQNKSTINQSKIYNINIIIDLMNRLFRDRWRHHGPYGESLEEYFTINDCSLTEWARLMIGPNKEDRNIHPDLFHFSPRLLRGFFDALILGDGSIHKENNHTVIYCPNKRSAGQYQVIASIIGLSANVRTDDRTGNEREYNGHTIRHTKPNYVVSICRKSASLIKKEMQVWEDYTGKVYCPRTEHGLIFVRGTGLPFWCGNTHELVRHRAGMGYSQESLRYVRLTDIKAWLPRLLDSLESGDSIKELFRETISYLEGVQAKLAEMADIDHGKGFKAKKQLTSMFRRLAPIGLATTIMATGNIRAWRHIVNMRASEAAEEEMQVVMDQVAPMLKENFPACFQDLSRTEEGVWGFGLNPKV